MPQCLTVFFRTLWYSVTLISFLFHSVSQCFHSVSQCLTVFHSVYLLSVSFFVSQCLFVLCATLCRTLWYSVALISFLFHSVSQCFHRVSQCLFCTLRYSVSYSVVLCGIKYSAVFLFVSQCYHSVSKCLFVLCGINMSYNVFVMPVFIYQQK